MATSALARFSSMGFTRRISRSSAAPWMAMLPAVKPAVVLARPPTKPPQPPRGKVAKVASTIMEVVRSFSHMMGNSAASCARNTPSMTCHSRDFTL